MKANAPPSQRTPAASASRKMTPPAFFACSLTWRSRSTGSAFDLAMKCNPKSTAPVVAMGGADREVWLLIYYHYDKQRAARDMPRSRYNAAARTGFVPLRAAERTSVHRSGATSRLTGGDSQIIESTCYVITTP